MPAIIGRSKYDVFKFLLTRMKDRLASWRQHTLSDGGKEVLIKAVLNVIPTYIMSVFRLSHKLCLELMKQVRLFWWRKHGKLNYVHWALWNLLCHSKKDGGLCFRDLEAFNSALLAKYAWNFQELFQRGLRWVMGDGVSIHILKDKWIPGISMPLGSRESADGFDRVADLMDGSELVRQGRLDNPVCQQCGVDVEDVSHIFFRCYHSVQVWKLSPLHSDFLAHPSSFFLEWCDVITGVSVLSEERKSILVGLASFCLWAIWKARNKIIFEQTEWNPLVVVNLALTRFWEFVNVHKKCQLVIHPSKRTDAPSRWSRPVHGVVKCNVDASFSKLSQLGGGGAVFRDSSGLVLQTVIFKSFVSSSVLESESFCFSRAVFWARMFKFPMVCFESDFKKVVDTIGGVCSSDVSIVSLVSEIRQELQYFSIFSILHVRQQGNRVANALARLSKISTSTDLVLQSLPLLICKLVELDLLDVASLRLSFVVVFNEVGRKW
ncbi:uncharacterized protein LOC132282349 [Cornus florida]|uniref:uncharacterized protein LOC132282349 n=1 Tax=Cornus florida TaxID=4283 RepID=UPI0028965BF9|nr:uncharacterized protein LOC132282349 [Cornus florida]